MSTSLDSSFSQLVRRLPAPLRREARQLPRSLGFTSGSWHTYATLEPVCDLPGMAGVREGLAEARFAHHCGGFWGLSCDRASDGQLAAEVSRPLLRALRSHWAEATGDAVFAGTHGAKPAEQAWRLERAQRRGGRRALSEYVLTSWRKVTWFPIATLVALRASRSVEDRAEFLRATACMMLALQLVDDAADSLEDALRFGRSVPMQLGLAPRALAELALGFSDDAADRFERARFSALARWNHDRTRELEAYFGLARAS